MGEIADALRRAHNAGGLRSEPSEPVIPAAPPPDHSLSRRAESSPRGGSELEPGPSQPAVPTDSAIVGGQGAELEACRQLSLHMRIALEQRGVRSAAIVSALRNEGKTTTSCNLALALASLSAGRTVALVDLDLRKPSVAKVLGLDAQLGVESILTGASSVDEVRIAIEGSSLDVYPAVAAQRAAHETLTRGPLGEFIAELEQRYETVLVDTPPTLLVPDARLILHHVAVCIPVARAGKTRVRTFRELIEALPRDRVLSALLNAKRGRGHYYYQGYDYADGAAASANTQSRRAPRRRRRAGKN